MIICVEVKNKQFETQNRDGPGLPLKFSTFLRQNCKFALCDISSLSLIKCFCLKRRQEYWMRFPLSSPL